MEIGIDWYSMRIPYAKKVELLKTNPERLISVVVNHHYNEYCRSRCDGKGGKDYLGKRIPCITSEWWDIDFNASPYGEPPYKTEIYIAAKETWGKPTIIVFASVNTKWGYPHRVLTGSEREQVLAYLDAAMVPCTWDEQFDRLKQLWDYMQTLKV